MSCVWDGLLEALKLTLTPRNFLFELKKSNIKTIHMEWNSSKLTDQQLDENYHRIKSLSYKDISDGYNCSSFEPLLFLIAEIYGVSIEHNYLGNKIEYTN